MAAGRDKTLESGGRRVAPRNGGPGPHPDHPDRSGSQAGRATPPPPTHAAHAAGRPLRCINWPCTALSNGWLSLFFFFCLRLRFDGHSTRWRWRSVELRLFVPLRSDSAGPAFPSHPSRLACIPLTAISSRLCGWLRERDPVVAEQMPRTRLAVQCQRRRRNHCGFGLRTRPGPGTVLYPFRPAMVPKFCC